jgi:hypothetical protein
MILDITTPQLVTGSFIAIVISSVLFFIIKSHIAGRFYNNPVKYIPTDKSEQQFIVRQFTNKSDPNTDSSGNDYFLLVKYIFKGKEYLEPYYRYCPKEDIGGPSGHFAKPFNTVEDAEEFARGLSQNAISNTSFSQNVALS